jgi:Thioesterase domain
VRRRPPQLDVGTSTCETKVLRVVFGPAPLLSTMDGMTLDKWVPFRNEASVVRCRVFCFPHAGGNATFYRPLRRFMPAEVDFCPVELPGRTARLDEPPFTSMSALMERLNHALQPLMGVPFGFWPQRKSWSDGGRAWGAGANLGLPRPETNRCRRWAIDRAPLKPPGPITTSSEIDVAFRSSRTAYHGAVEDQAHNRLFGERTGVPGIPVTLHLSPYPTHRVLVLRRRRTAPSARGGPGAC